MHVEPHDPPEHLAELARTERRGKVARRLMAVRSAMLGRTARQVAAEVLLSDRQVRTRVARDHAEGTAGLVDRAGRGREGPLTPEQAARLVDRPRAGPTEADGGCAFAGADIRRILAEEFGVVRSLQPVYDLLHRRGFEPPRPRPRPPGADAAAQAAFKKVSPIGPPRSRPSGPASGPRSGSRMRPASARRAR